MIKSQFLEHKLKLEQPDVTYDILDYRPKNYVRAYFIYNKYFHSVVSVPVFSIKDLLHGIENPPTIAQPSIDFLFA